MKAMEGYRGELNKVRSKGVMVWYAFCMCGAWCRVGMVLVELYCSYVQSVELY